MTIDLVAPHDDRTRTAPVFPLRTFGNRVAVVTKHETLSYAELADRVDARATELGPVRRLVMVRAANAVEPLVTYLAALAGGHPLLLADADDGPRAARMIEAYRPDVIAGATKEGWRLDEIRQGTCHRLHPDLALLLSTSGSTGSPKL
ncbi:MAG: hypothetical protein ACJ72A_06350, partial [Nocardioidaceae bacterium]